MSNNSLVKVFTVAGLLCVVCSVVVSTSAVSLRSLQQKNQALDKKKNILSAAGLEFEKDEIEQIYQERIEARIVDLSAGGYTDAVDPSGYNLRKAAKDPKQSVVISSEKDLPGIGRKPKLMPVYLVKDQGAFSRVILPIHGKGLWSTLWGFLALDKNLSTIQGLTFYEHAETPGLGGEVDNPRWKASWIGKEAFAPDGSVGIEVIKGSVDLSREEAKYQIDGLSGATITARGVSNTLKYWLGDEGYGPFLKTAKEKGL